MRRRDFLATLGVGAAGAISWGGTVSDVLAEPLNPETGFLLSTTGCSAATAHPAANKIVTVDGKTHVGWLDSDNEGFKVRVRTLNRASGHWSPKYTVGDAFDNHGGPALTVDSKGFLHAVYYPHHHSFRYRRSTRPNDASEWTNEVSFGKRCTYPSPVCGRDDTLYLACRESGGPQ
ncbi:MAG: BNR-4 repeat-containing protein [Planctomycetes bacterium]|nr:BNR-4 repeat-containing protein [Planctomycetota bacterium]MBL7038199.1 BNR-4 repeat-containing protein [Pirellulaceae bacterium]